MRSGLIWVILNEFLTRMAFDRLAPFFSTLAYPHLCIFGLLPFMFLIAICYDGYTDTTPRHTKKASHSIWMYNYLFIRSISSQLRPCLANVHFESFRHRKISNRIPTCDCMIEDSITFSCVDSPDAAHSINTSLIQKDRKEERKRETNRCGQPTKQI